MPADGRLGGILLPGDDSTVGMDRDEPPVDVAPLAIADRSRRRPRQFQNEPQVAAFFRDRRPVNIECGRRGGRRTGGTDERLDPCAASRLRLPGGDFEDVTGVRMLALRHREMIVVTARQKPEVGRSLLVRLYAPRWRKFVGKPCPVRRGVKSCRGEVLQCRARRRAISTCPRTTQMNCSRKDAKKGEMKGVNRGDAEGKEDAGRA